MPSDSTILNPLVSIVIPSFNQGRFIAETLESVFAQDYQPLEVLVLDGGSRDETVAILEQFTGRPGFWWKSERDEGVVDAVNQGLRRATGAYCGILSADDCFTPGAIRAAMSHFQTDSSLDLVYADSVLIDAAGQELGRTSIGDYNLAYLLSRRTYIMQCSAFFRTKLAQELGGWRPSVSYVADNDLWLRMALVGRVARVPGVWSRYRFHDAQRDTQSDRIVADWRQSIADLEPRLSTGLRRAARLGCHLTRYRYPQAPHWWSRTKSLYAAMSTDPRCLLWREFPRIELLQPARQGLSWLKRRLIRRQLAPTSQ